jgi:hypothetical protein
MKGVVIGTIITTGAIMLYNETSNSSKRKVMKKGKQMAKKMGIL